MGKSSRAKRQRRQCPPAPTTPPPEVAEAIDRASESDRTWFELHPEAEYRERPEVDGEFWPKPPFRVAFVLIFQVRPGVRARYAMFRLPLQGTERIQ
jgi:hypothetical protein